MKKYLAYTLIAFSVLVIVFSPVFSVYTAQADHCTANEIYVSTAPPVGEHICRPLEDGETGVGGIISDTAVGAFNDITGGLLDVLSWVSALVGDVFLGIVGFILFLSGILLNGVVNMTIVGGGEWIDSIDGITVAWGIIRDLANTIFIFILVYISIGTILNIEKVNAKKLLANVIIAALLINFSLFFTRVIIDAANILSYEIYQEIGKLNEDPGFFASLDGGLSGAVMDHLDLTTIYNSSDENTDPRRLILIGVIGSIFGLITAFIFFAASILLLIRFVSLAIMMVFSPIGFVGGLLPQLGAYSKKFWSKLISQAFFAPAYFLSMFVSLKIMADDSFKQNLADLTGYNRLGGFSFEHLANTAGADAADAGAIVINFIIVSMFMVGSLIIAKGAGKRGAITVSKWGDNLQKYARKEVGRQTVGRAAILAKRGGGIGAEKLLGSKKFAPILRRIPLASEVLGAVGAVGRRDISTAKKRVDAQNLSNNALKARWAKATTTSAEKAAIANILASKDDLKPAIHLGLTADKIKAARNDLSARGESTKDIDSKFHQYAGNHQEKAGMSDAQKEVQRNANRAERVAAIQGNKGSPTGRFDTSKYDHKNKDGATLGDKARGGPKLKGIKADAVKDLKFVDEADHKPEKDNGYFADTETLDAMLATFGSGHVERLIEDRNDGAALTFIDYLAGKYKGKKTVQGLSRWVRESTTNGGLNNSSLSGWILRKKAEDILSVYGFTRERKTDSGEQQGSSGGPTILDSSGNPVRKGEAPSGPIVKP